jgi:hypothetical protein
MELHTHPFPGAAKHVTVVRHNENKNITRKTEFESAAFPTLQKFGFFPWIREVRALRCRHRTVPAATHLQPKPGPMTCRSVGIRTRKFRDSDRRAGAAGVKLAAMFMKSGSQTIHMKIRKKKQSSGRISLCLCTFSPVLSLRFVACFGVFSDRDNEVTCFHTSILTRWEYLSGKRVKGGNKTELKS